MPVFVKICGLRTVDAVDAAVASGVDAIGFVFAESPRRIPVAQAAKLASRMPESVLRVAVMHHPSQAEWAEVESGLAPDWLQTDAGDFDALEIGTRVIRLPVYRDNAALDADALAREQRIVFEAPKSGAGQRADWDRARRFAKQTELVLAGGLDADNVRSAILQVRPWGVDVSSGVERSRGEKDPERIVAFIEAVKRTELTDAV